MANMDLNPRGIRHPQQMYPDSRQEAGRWPIVWMLVFAIAFSVILWALAFLLVRYGFHRLFS